MTEARYTIAIDRDLCMGSGVCVVTAAHTEFTNEQTKSVQASPSAFSSLPWR